MNPDIINIHLYAKNFGEIFPEHTGSTPWQLVGDIANLISSKIKLLSNEFTIQNDVAIHRTANIEQHCIIKGPAIIGENVFIGAHAYLRGGVYLDTRCSIGPGCEIKSTIVLSGSALAHFNFAGDSIIGSNVNMEAGSVIANHYNERKNKTIYMLFNGKPLAIDSTKFGSLVGDGTRIGANAVLSPGSLLKPDSVVKRLELIEQCPEI
jgi:bifunctional N-acetylglucosamine-1-phosphate-uridyltransferase/glucosamine-1-phosphate-acetyltransferase GlmU-like protein